MNTLVNPVPAAAVAELEALYDEGRYVAAHALAVARHGPLADWSGGPTALVFACRLAGNLGGDRLAHRLILRARRCPSADPTERAQAALYHAFRTWGRRGPLALRRFLTRPGVRTALDAGATPETRADVLCLQAHVAAAFRDTDTSESCWQQARVLAADRPWTWRERAALLVSADRYPEALDAARESLRLQPWFRPGVQQAAQILSLLGRDDEAVDLLESAIDPQQGNLESAAVAAQLAELYAELLRPTDVLRLLDRHEALSPLQEKVGRDWLASRRGEACLQLGDLTGSADAAESLAATNFFYEKTVPRLRDPVHQAARRVALTVPFVRQHDRTCAPATLAALTRFWHRPADQDAITREICYGGTFDHQERHWAETHGWVVREFRTDWPGSVALLDAGIPFTLATVGINSGHLQAVVGYDARRGTLIVRDPFDRNQTELLAEEFLARYAFCGPRAMALVPADDPAAVARLRARTLPETALYDGIYRLRLALHAHDRPAARAALTELETLDPAARLTHFAQRELAYYDGDDPAALAAVEGLLALYPNEGRLRLEKLHVLRRLARPAEARAWLETCAADRAHTEPNLWRELARDLAADAREHPRARLLLARSLFYEPTESEHLRALAELLWDERDHAESAALFRLAATAAATREDYWQQFFIASRHLRATDDALRLLDARFRRLGDRSSQPARTLHWAHRERHAFAPAAEVLEDALQRRPDDGDLLLFAALTHARDGEQTPAARYLARAEGHVAPGAFSRAAAEMADLAHDAPGALARWREVLAREPLNPAAHRAVARLLEETDPRGPAAAREHLNAAVARFPHAVALHEQRIGALAEDPGRGTPEHLAAVAALLAVQPTNVWAHRENVLAHQIRREFPAAFAALDEAGRLDPLAPPTHALRGRLLTATGDLPAARASLRRALELDADLTNAFYALLEASPTLADKRAALDFMHGCLVKQPFVGDGILAYRDAAYPILGEPELLAQLDAILAARPDLWQAWSAAAWQHADAARLDAAHAHAQSAAERFPLLPRVWLDLAAIEKIRADDPGEVAALERVLRIRSTYGDASRRLAAAHRRAGRFPEARAVLETAIAAAPLDVANRGALAETLWQQDRRAHGPRALELLVDAVRREPGYDWGWDTLERYARTLEQPALAETTARQLTTTRPGEARSWLRLAFTLHGETGPALAERLAALDRVLALNPRANDAYDLRARLLVAAGRYDDALAACQPPADAYPGGTHPHILDGRAAWVLARRGDLPAARARMRQVVADHPGYEWGWRMLADWAEAAKDKEENLTAAERVAYLSPHAAAPQGYLAAARLALGLRAGAKTALREAMRRDPSYLYAPSTLLAAQLDDQEFDAAEETLRFFAQHHPGPPTLGRTVLLAAKRKTAEGRTRAADALAALALIRPAPGTDDGDLTGAVDAMIEAGWIEDAENALAPALKTPATANPDAGALWVRCRADRGKWWQLRQAVRALPEGEFARRARVAFLGALAKRRANLGLIIYLWQARALLRADTESWGQTGYALTTCAQYRRAARWLADYRARPDAQGWMLSNLVISLRALGRYKPALEVNRHALTLPPDRTRPKHVAWVALEDALTDGEEARQRAARLYAEIAPRLEKLEQPFRYLNVLTGQILIVRAQSDPAARLAAYRQARATLRTERKPVAASLRRANRAVGRAETHARRRLSRDAGGWWRDPGAWMFSWPALTFGWPTIGIIYLVAKLLTLLAATGAG